MASELCMNCFSVKGQFEVCPYCGYVEGTPPAQPHCLTPGTILKNHFIVGTVIGFGGFGITYKCFDTTLGITVAAKEFYPMGLVNRSPGESRVGLMSGEKREQYREQLKRFVMEAQSVAQFGKAKDIVNVFDFFEENGTAYMIMEYIDGILLKDYLEKQGPMPPDVAMSVIMPIIEAVKKIHSKGIIHRDISPDNIFITDEKSIKIFDFGAAQLNRSKEGMAGEKVIKVGYSAPEQYRDNSKQDFYTDIYSVGAIMYQLLTGRKPIESTSREYKDKLKSPMELGIKVNSNVDKAVMEALAVKPELRYQGIQQFEDALRNKRVAEYPKEKIRKQKRKRNWILVSAATLTLAVGIAIFIGINGINGHNEPIFDTYVASGTSVTVWVENEDQKTQMEDLIKHGFENEGDTISLEGMNKADRKKWNKFWEENEQVNVDVVVAEEGIEERLKNTPEDQLPNMYITDHVSDEQKKKTNLVSLNDVYDSLSTNEYDMSGYSKQFPDIDEMPTGIDTLLLYVCSIDYNKDNTLFEGTATEGTDTNEAAIKLDSYNETNIVELSNLISSDTDSYLVDSVDGSGQLLSNKLAVFDRDAIASAAYLLEEDEWNDFFAKDGGIYPKIENLESIQKFNSRAIHTAYALNSDPNIKTVDENDVIDEGLVYGGNIVAGTAFRRKLDDAISEQSGKKNPVTGYQTYVVTHDEKMLAIYSERYGITGISDNSQKNVCERLLYMMMDSIGQQKKIANSSSTTLPIRTDQRVKFVDIRKNMAGYINLCDKGKTKGYSRIIVADITGNMSQFVKLINNLTEKDDIQKVCKDYMSSEQTTENEDSGGKGATGESSESDDTGKQEVTEESSDSDDTGEHEATEVSSESSDTGEQAVTEESENTDENVTDKKPLTEILKGIDE